ncbi:MAG: hypothetical protein ACRENA_05760 [Vulcanimicrobiaceae bacterium]
MIRSNNPAIDFETLRVKVHAKASTLRESGVVERRRSEPVSLPARYRAVTAYLDRADDFGYPEARLPHRLKVVERVSPRGAVAILRLYNFIFRRARDASAAQTQALRELAEAGAVTAQRLAVLDQQMARLRDAVERLQGREP